MRLKISDSSQTCPQRFLGQPGRPHTAGHECRVCGWQPTRALTVRVPTLRPFPTLRTGSAPPLPPSPARHRGLH